MRATRAGESGRTNTMDRKYYRLATEQMSKQGRMRRKNRKSYSVKHSDIARETIEKDTRLLLSKDTREDNRRGERKRLNRVEVRSSLGSE